MGCPRHKQKHAKFSEKLASLHAPVKLDDIKWAEDWLGQHIKNSDFGYIGNLVHDVPEPYVWDNTFAVDYSRLDSDTMYCSPTSSPYHSIPTTLQHWLFSRKM